jgi:hypothetical protein
LNRTLRGAILYLEKNWKEPDPREQTVLLSKWIAFFPVFELAGRLRTRLFLSDQGIKNFNVCPIGL